MESQTRPLNLTERIKNFAYNFKYKAVAMLEEYPLETALSPYQTAYLLGRQFQSNPANVQETNLSIAATFRDIIWITYRSGFPELLKDCGNDSSFVTDTGWGCMIRVGQMLFAQFLRDYLRPASKDEYSEICEHFNDFHHDATFSIQKIARLGKKEFNLKPGQWYNPAQIAYILSGFMN